MSNILKVEKVSLFMELIPFLFQLMGIISLLFVAYPDQYYSLLGIILSILWINFSKSNLPDEYGKLRMQRRLFESIAAWFNRTTATEEYDKIQEETLLIDGSLEEDRYRELVSAAGIVNFARSTASFFLHLYVLYIGIEILTSIL